MKVIIILLVLVACSPEKIYVDNYCLLSNPITDYCYKADDEDCPANKVLPLDILTQIERHNTTWCGLCDEDKCEE